MNINVRALLVVIAGLASACSTDSAKRLTFETLQNVKEQECQKERSSDCQKREGYDDYHRKQIELDPSSK